MKSGALVVNGDIVTHHQIQQEWHLVHQQFLKTTYSQFSERQKEDIAQITLAHAKQNIIKRIILEQEALKHVADIPYQELYTHYEKLLKHFGGEQAVRERFMDTTIAKHGADALTSFTLQENIERGLKVERLIANWEQELPDLTDSDLKDFYAENQQLYPAKARIEVSIVEGAAPTAADTDTEYFTEVETHLQQFVQQYEELGATERQLLQLLTNVQKFPELHLRSRVLIESGTLDASVEEYLFALPEQTLSGLVRTQDNVRLFFKYTDLPAGVWEFEYVAASVAKDAQMARRNALVQQKLSVLQAQAHVEDSFTA